MQEKMKEVRVVHCSHPCCDCSSVTPHPRTVTNSAAIPRSWWLFLTWPWRARSITACCGTWA